MDKFLKEINKEPSQHRWDYLILAICAFAIVFVSFSDRDRAYKIQAGQLIDLGGKNYKCWEYK